MPIIPIGFIKSKHTFITLIRKLTETKREILIYDMKKIRIPDVLKLNYDKLYDICNNGKVLSEEDTLILAACGILRCKIENKDIKDLMMFTYVFITTQKSKFDISKWYDIACKTTRKGPIPLKQMIQHPFTRKKCKSPVDLEKIIKDANSWEEEWVI